MLKALQRDDRDTNTLMSTRQKRLLLSAVLLLVSFVLGYDALARPAATNVDILDRSYRDVERLVSYGLCNPPMIDQRPLSRIEIARLVLEAKNNFSKTKVEETPSEEFKKFHKEIARKRAIGDIIDRLSADFSDELADLGDGEKKSPLIVMHPLEYADFGGVLLSSAPTTILPENGVGAINAVVNPLMDYNSGRHAINGSQVFLETMHRLRITKHVAALASPRFELNAWRNNGDSGKALLQEGYATVQFGDAQLEFGRDEMIWGPSQFGSLILTNNARPLDMIKLSTPSPLRLPWVFKYLGSWRVAFFGANLGPSVQPYPYTWMTGYRLSYMPVKYLELGFGNVTLMGGDGAAELSAWDIFGEFWGFRPAGTDPTSPNKTNHIMEATALIRIPQAYGLQLYGVLCNEDKRDTLLRFFRDGSSYLAGVYLPRLDNTGKLDLRFEVKKMSPIAYRHGLFSDGFTLNQLIIGDDLGPAAWGAHAQVNYDPSKNFGASFIFDWDSRSSNLYTTLLDPDGTLGDIVVTASRPSEQRYRFVARPYISLRQNLKIFGMLGYERVLNAKYVDGVSRNNWLLGVVLRMNFDSHFGFKWGG